MLYYCNFYFIFFVTADEATTRFFYNLGHEFFMYLQSKFSMPTLQALTIMDDQHSHNNNDQQLQSENDLNFVNAEFGNLNIHREGNPFSTVNRMII